MSGEVFDRSTGRKVHGSKMEWSQWLSGSGWMVVIRPTVIFVALLTLTLLLGKKQMSQLTFFNYVTGITIGSIAANMVTESDVRFWDDFVAMSVWAGLTILTGYIGLKWRKARVLLDGEPTILIRNGVLCKKALRQTHLNIDDVTMLLRDQSVFSMQEVHYAILEPNGRLSILLKQGHQSVTKTDMQVPEDHYVRIPMEVISDGQLIVRNLRELQLSEHWLLQALKTQGVDTISEVFYAEVQVDGTLMVIR